MTDKSKHTGIDCPICGREFFVGDILNTGNIDKINKFEALTKQRDDLLNSCRNMASILNGLHFGTCLNIIARVDTIRRTEEEARKAIKLVKDAQ